MYKKKNRILNSQVGLENYIEGIDIYNSEFLSLLSDPTLERTDYEITTYQYRPDLIAKDFYGDTSYTGLLILQAARNLSGFKRGGILRLLDKNIIENLLSKL